MADREGDVGAGERWFSLLALDASSVRFLTALSGTLEDVKAPERNARDRRVRRMVAAGKSYRMLLPRSDCGVPRRCTRSFTAAEGCCPGNLRIWTYGALTVCAENDRSVLLASSWPIAQPLRHSIERTGRLRIDPLSAAKKPCQ